jgi:twitching motility protein PilT
VARIDAIFKLVRDKGASDLHLDSGSRPILRLDGEIHPVEYEELSGEVLEELLREMMRPQDWARYEEEGEADFGYEVPGVLRVRCNVFQQRKGIAGAFRILPSHIFTVEQLGLPEVIKTFATLTKGLVVVTGPPGSGKSTTQAALIDHVNRTRRVHIITIEDPIEYVHENQLSLINQREVGRHTKGFDSALRAALREDPNIILVGEMRDLETISLAITAAETGQLVFGTLHTASAAQTIDRLIDVFEGDRQEQIRTMLAESLQGVVAQRLLRRADGRGRVAAFEILVGTSAVRAMVREKKTFQIQSAMQSGKRAGMQLMDDQLAGLLRQGTISVDEARRHATRKDAFPEGGLSDRAAA